MTNLAWMRPLLARLVGDAEPRAYDEDVAQAIRCLEALREAQSASFFISRAHRWRVEIEGKWPCFANITAHTLPEAVCGAISAALGWKEGDP